MATDAVLWSELTEKKHMLQTTDMNRYYERKGLRAIGNFVDPDDGWPGTVLEADTAS